VGEEGEAGLRDGSKLVCPILFEDDAILFKGTTPPLMCVKWFLASVPIYQEWTHPNGK